MNGLKELKTYLGQMDNISVKQVFFDLGEVINTNIEKKYPYVFWNFNTIKFTDDLKGSNDRFTIRVFIVANVKDYEIDAKLELWDELHSQFVEYVTYLESIALSYPYNFLNLNQLKGEYFDRGQVSIDDEIGIGYDIELLGSDCTMVIPETFDLILTAETGGTTVPVPGTYTENNGTYKAFYASPSAGYRFKQWLLSTAPNLTNPLAVVYRSAMTLVAQFIAQFQLTTSVVGNGTITPASGLKDDGETITLTATPDAGNHFVDWVINSVQYLTSTVNYTITQATTAIATFASDFVNLIMSKTGTGTITPDVGTTSVELGTIVPLTATVTDTDFFFKEWDINGTIETDNPYNLTIAEETNILATFERYFITPFEADAVEIWDGNILRAAGPTYYLIGRKGVGNLLITGFDFDTYFDSWLKGFPYKSAATVSAPAGNAALIAADVNNFFYDSGGTPNQIPVVSFFQDIDYANKLFCRHEAQVLDGNGVEILQPNVREIVLYANVKAGADLTTCNSYFGVPVEDVTAKWIDPVNGVDATGTGTKASPYKTHSKVNGLTLTEGIQVYCKTGTISPIAWSKNYNLKAVGFTKILNSVSVRGIDQDTAGTLSMTIEGYIIDMNNVASSVCWNCNITHNVTLKRMYFTKSASANGHLTSPNGANLTLSLINCIFTELKPVVTGGKNITMDTCHVVQSTNMIDANATGLTKIIIKNSQLNGITTACIKQWVPFSIDFFGNTYYNSNLIVSLANAAANAGTIKIFSNKAYSTINYNILNFQRAAYAFEIHDNNFNYPETTGSLMIIEGASHSIYNNIIDNTKSHSILVITNTLSHTKTVEIKKNRFMQRNINASYIVSIGEETLSARNGNITSVIAEENYLLGPLEYGSGATPTHGIMIGFVANLYIRRNNIKGNVLDIAVKGTLFTDSYLIYNVFSNAVRPFVLASTGALKVYNNTGYIASSDISSETVVRFASQPTPGGIAAANSVLKNNIFYNDDLAITIQTSDSSTFASDYNVYKPSSNYQLEGVDKTLAQFKALGYEAHGIEQSITFDANLIPSTPIAIGENLGAAYEDGLDVTTDWGDENTLPVVVTKKQTGNWQIGAYIQ